MTEAFVETGERGAKLWNVWNEGLFNPHGG